MAKLFVKSGDTDKVISGEDKGKTGKVQKAFPETGKIIVEGVAMVKKHQKPNNEYPQGGIVDVEAPIHVSNVMLIDPSTKKPTRVGFKVEDGKKVRVAKKTGNTIA